MFYDRKIKYIHLYEKGTKVQNVGFVKLETIEDRVNVHVHIAGVRRAHKEDCKVMVKGKGETLLLGKMCLEQGKGSLDIRDVSEWSEENLSYDDWEEIYTELPTGDVLRCIIREKSEETMEETAPFPLETEVEEAELLQETFAKEENLTVEIVPEKEPLQIKVSPRVVYPDSREKSMTMAADKWQQLWRLYPHMTPFEDGREYLVVTPGDFVVLQKKYYNLAANSFLLHGYYNYEHLLMCRMAREGEECFYIGVPGNFYEKEKQVALLFGFESFEGKREPAGNGDFGYYMVRVEI